MKCLGLHVKPSVLFDSNRKKSFEINEIDKAETPQVQYKPSLSIYPYERSVQLSQGTCLIIIALNLSEFSIPPPLPIYCCANGVEVKYDVLMSFYIRLGI